MLPSCKAKGPVLSHRAFAESVLYPGFRLQSKQDDCIRGRLVIQPSPAKQCPVCHQRRLLDKPLALTLFGQRFQADVCASCHDAAKTSANYRQTAAHSLAQHQLYRGDCHA